MIRFGLLLTLALLTVCSLFVPGMFAAPYALAIIVAPDNWQRLSSIDFTSGGTGRFTADKIGYERWRAFLLRFSILMNKAGATSFGTIATDGIVAAVRSVSWFDKQPVKKLPLTLLRYISHLFLRGKDTVVTNVTATNANQTGTFDVILDHQLQRTDAPDLTLVDLLPNMSSAVLELGYGTVEDVIAGGDYSTKAFGASSVELYGLKEQAQGPRMPSSSHYEYIEQAFSSNAQSAFKIPIPIDQWIRGICLYQFTKGPDVSITTLLAAANLISVELNGTTIFGPISWEALRNRNTDDYGIAQPTGVAYIDFTYDKQFRKALNATVPDQATADRVKSLNLVVQTSSVASAYLGVVVLSVRGPRMVRV